MATDMPSSLKKGPSVTTRALFSAIGVANGAPTLATQQMVPVGMTKHIDIVLKQTVAGKTAVFKLWWWYSDAGVWVADAGVGTPTIAGIGTAAVVTIPSAASGLYVELVSITAAGAASAWAIGRGTIGRS